MVKAFLIHGVEQRGKKLFVQANVLPTSGDILMHVAEERLPASRAILCPREVYAPRGKNNTTSLGDQAHRASKSAPMLPDSVKDACLCESKHSLVKPGTVQEPGVFEMNLLMDDVPRDDAPHASEPSVNRDFNDFIRAVTP